MEIKKKKQQVVSKPMGAQKVETAKSLDPMKGVSAKSVQTSSISAKELKSPSLSITIPKKSKSESAKQIQLPSIKTKSLPTPTEGARPMGEQKMEGAKQIQLPSLKAKDPSASLPKIEKKKKKKIYIGEPIDVVAKGR